MTDAIDRLIAIKEQAEFLLSQQDEINQKLVDETAKLETQVALASALAALKAASADCKHERVRTQINGAREQVLKVLGAA